MRLSNLAAFCGLISLQGLAAGAGVPYSDVLQVHMIGELTKVHDRFRRIFFFFFCVLLCERNGFFFHSSA
jgi:hypothetical protein